MHGNQKDVKMAVSAPDVISASGTGAVSFAWSTLLIITLPKFNIASEMLPSQKESNLTPIIFQGVNSLLKRFLGVTFWT